MLLVLLLKLAAIAHGVFVEEPSAELSTWERATGFVHVPAPAPAAGFLYYNRSAHARAAVSYDGRSVRIDNQSTILLGGSVHYMRLTPGMWADIFAEAKTGGLNAIETYCFWTDHEQVRGGGFLGREIHGWAFLNIYMILL